MIGGPICVFLCGVMLYLSNRAYIHWYLCKPIYVCLDYLQCNVFLLAINAACITSNKYKYKLWIWCPVCQPFCFTGLYTVITMQMIRCYYSSCIYNTTIEYWKETARRNASIHPFVLSWPSLFTSNMLHFHIRMLVTRKITSIHFLKYRKNKQAVQADQFNLFHHDSVYRGLLMIENRATTWGSRQKVSKNFEAARIALELCNRFAI